MRSMAALLTVCSCCCSLPVFADGSAKDSTAVEVEKGFTTELFDGKTLEGWTVENDCSAAVEDGMILLKEGNGWLRSDYTYADFKLHVECKALQKTGYDAGIYLRTTPGGKPFPKRGYQANLLQGRVGHIGNLPGAVTTGLIRPAGEWNAFDITVVGETVTMVINGKPAYTVEGAKIPSGYIGLQVEVPKGGQFHVRNVRVTELSHRSLFNGTDLTGWEGAGKSADVCWKAENGELICTGQKGGPWLRSKQEFGDFNLRFDYQVSDGGNSGVYVRVPASGNHHRADDSKLPAGFEVQILDDNAAKYRKLKLYQFCGSIYDIQGAVRHVGRPAGQWNTLEINCKGHHVTTTHNGVVIVDATPEEFPLLKLRQLKGFLGLQNHSTLVKYRRLRIGPPMGGYPAPPKTESKAAADAR